MERNDEKRLELKNPVVHQKNENCQVFNGPINGCVFAMPGANITQQPGQPSASLDEKEQDIVKQLRPMFFSNEEEAKRFLVSIQGMKPTQITDLVNKLVEGNKISGLSKKRSLWKVLHDCGIYAPSESNWNSQVK